MRSTSYLYLIFDETAACEKSAFQTPKPLNESTMRNKSLGKPEVGEKGEVFFSPTFELSTPQ